MNTSQFAEHVIRIPGEVSVRQIKGFDLDVIVTQPSVTEANQQFQNLLQFCRENLLEVQRPDHLRPLPVEDEAIFKIDGKRLMVAVVGGIYQAPWIGITIQS